MDNDVGPAYNIIIGAELMCIVLSAEALRLTAVHTSPYTLRLYRELRNEDKPSQTEKAATEAEVRRRVCADITGSGFFLAFNLVPLDVEQILNNWYRHKYSEIFHTLFSCSASLDTCRYENPYHLQDFFNEAHLSPFKEHVFVCPLEYLPDNTVIYIYVSKEYNVGSKYGPYMPGRFLLGNLYPDFIYVDYGKEPILAEQPGIAHSLSSFNIEKHYLQTRKYAEIAENKRIDPLCRVVSRANDDEGNQHNRLCVAVCSSDYFRDKVAHPHPRTYPCSMKRISFRTTAGIVEADGKSYFERMTRCSINFLEKGREGDALYVSRAYRSNKVFVFIRKAAGDRDIYLESVTYNISVVDELNSFDFVEN